jgi:hypothetical protein
MGPQEPAMLQLLTFEQVAAQIGTSRFAVEQLVRRGELTLVKLSPRMLRVESRSLASYLRRKLAETKRVPPQKGEST